MKVKSSNQNFIFMSGDIILAILTSTAISSIATAIITSKLKWGVEKKRLIHNNKKKLLEATYKEINKPNFSYQIFRISDIYQRIKPHLSSKLIKTIESKRITIYVHEGNHNAYSEIIAAELNELEKKWELI